MPTDRSNACAAPGSPCVPPMQFYGASFSRALIRACAFWPDYGALGWLAPGSFSLRPRAPVFSKAQYRVVGPHSCGDILPAWRPPALRTPQQTPRACSRWATTAFTIQWGSGNTQDTPGGRSRLSARGTAARLPRVCDSLDARVRRAMSGTCEGIAGSATASIVKAIDFILSPRMKARSVGSTS
jgi:hypothetical protein